MHSDAQLVWRWVEKCKDDKTCWCGAEKYPGLEGPQFDGRLVDKAWEDVRTHHDNEVWISGRRYWYKVLEGQNKRDGRGAQGNVQLVIGKKIYMNLHVPLHKKAPKVTDADGWTTVPSSKPQYRSKKRR